MPSIISIRVSLHNVRQYPATRLLGESRADDSACVPQSFCRSRREALAASHPTIRRLPQRAAAALIPRKFALAMDNPPAPVDCLSPADVVCHERLGELLRHYERRAAQPSNRTGTIQRFLSWPECAFCGLGRCGHRTHARCVWTLGWGRPGARRGS